MFWLKSWVFSHLDTNFLLFPHHIHLPRKQKVNFWEQFRSSICGGPRRGFLYGSSSGETPDNCYITKTCFLHRLSEWNKEVCPWLFQTGLLFPSIFPFPTADSNKHYQIAWLPPGHTPGKKMETESHWNLRTEVVLPEEPGPRSCRGASSSSYSISFFPVLQAPDAGSTSKDFASTCSCPWHFSEHFQVRGLCQIIGQAKSHALELEFIQSLMKRMKKWLLLEPRLS